MVQDTRNSYRTQETFFQQFYHSCLGKIIISLVVLGILFVIAVLTVPSNEKMEREMMDNIRQCIQDNDSIKTDGIDDAFANIGRIFTEADTTFNDKEVMEAFHEFNKLEIYRHGFYATALLRNNLNVEGTRVGIGIYNTVIPTIKYSDIVLFVNEIKKYKEKLIEPVLQDDYVGENPNLKPYHYLGDPDN